MHVTVTARRCAPPPRCAPASATGSPNYTQRQDAEAELAALQAATPTAMDPALLDEIPYAGDILLDLPLALKARLVAAFDISPCGTSPATRSPSRAVITDATLRALPDILNPGQDGYHDTAPADSPLTRTPLSVSLAQSTGSPPTPVIPSA
jgi:hypothetical protein